MQISARPVPRPTKQHPQGFVLYKTVDDATVYTDDWPVYNDLPRPHRVVNHRRGDYVDGDIHVQGIESLWAKMKRAYMGTYHWLSPRHLGRYNDEFAGRHNARDLDTIDQIRHIIKGMVGNRLRYEDLIA